MTGARPAENAEVRVRVPDERLDELASIAAEGLWRTSPTMEASVISEIREVSQVELVAVHIEVAALVADLRAARADNQRLREALSAPPVQCGCASTCGDDGDTEGPGTCKGLPRAPEPPLVEIMLVHRTEEPRA